MLFRMGSKVILCASCVLLVCFLCVYTVLLTHKKLLRNTQETLIIIAEPIQNITASLADAFLNIRSKEVWVVGGVTISRKNGFKNG